MVDVRRITEADGSLLRSMRMAALADAPGESTTTLSRVEAHDERHWHDSAVANASGLLQTTFFAESGEDPRVTVGMVGAYANQDGAVNVVGLWSAPGFRNSGVADALLDGVADWAREAGGSLLRIWVVERNEHARLYYEQHGFEATGTSMPYEPDPRINQLEMVRSL